jgi:D-xylose 1-dehydrogenase (NADP+, D-xylono-1,5-lactone-forming)
MSTKKETTMTDKTLNWGLLSTAAINRALIPPLRASSRNRLIAVGSRNQASADTYAKQRDIPKAYGSYEALLADPDIDVIYNPLPNHLHAQWSIKAMQAGKHVLCEKPLALTLAEIDAMAAAAHEHGRVLAEAFMYRHHPQTLKVKQLVDGGAIGRLQLIRGAFTFNIAQEDDIRLKPEMGGGAIWDVGCYPISYARLLAGSEPVEVFGQAVMGQSGVDESFFAQMRFPGDVYAQFDCGFRSPDRQRLEVIGTAGVLSMPVPFKPQLNETITLLRDDTTEVMPVEEQELYMGEVEDMTDCILSGKSPHMSLADSRANVAAILALLESAAANRPMKT